MSNEARRATSLAILTFLGFACLLPVVALIDGCSTTNRTAYVAESGTRVSVEAAMGLYNQLVKAGKISVAQEAQVKSAYEKVQASMVLVCDTGKAMSSSTSTNVLTSLEQVLTQAGSDYAQNKTDLFNLLIQLGVKL